MPPTFQMYMLRKAGWGKSQSRYSSLMTSARSRVPRCAVLKHVLKVLPHYGILQSSGDTRAFLNTCSVSTAGR
jgi:hypothetical protein